MGSNPKVHSFDEVAKHNSRTDCWLIISGKVYDVTPFLEDHLGGDEFLLNNTDVGHSDSAKEMMEKYYIGKVDSSTLPAKSEYTPPTQVPSGPVQSSGIATKILQFLVLLLVLGLAFALRNFGKKRLIRCLMN
ncbi:hypothetical protein ACJRO7_019109 [Eucalyptus globulus]|uniref:Cytochrome b5 heme-binding domain-containing protein n=1 Tax=Eucalyptus globulus TaxID=34317 RepID=A0ABD3KIT3_EUCGL